MAATPLLALFEVLGPRIWKVPIIKEQEAKTNKTKNKQ